VTLDATPVTLGVGSWTCSCGRLTLRNLRESGSGPMTVTIHPVCSHCGDIGEVLAVPGPVSDGEESPDD
jgi:hypothetical protein